MLFHSPPLDGREEAVLAEVARLRDSLIANTRDPRRWVGSLRRDSVARAIQGSNSIEGYDASLDDAAAVDLGEQPLDATQTTTLALKGYRDAMTFVLQQAEDDGFAYNEQLLKSLHFMMVNFDLAARPGLWRIGSIYVEKEDTHDIVYEGPPVVEVTPLIAELINSLNSPTESNPIVSAAIAHLNLVMIHPFRDGNGRMARCLQTLVLARSGIKSPEFSSIEEYLGKNTQAYYDVLAAVGGGRWRPEGDTRPWIRFTLTAHLRQARTMLRRFKEGELLWRELDRIVTTKNLPDRTFFALYDAANRYRIRNSTYRALVRTEEEISEATASRDLRQLLDAGLLQAIGEKRGRYYVASPSLRAVRERIVRSRDSRDDTDPFQSDR